MTRRRLPRELTGGASKVWSTVLASVVAATGCAGAGVEITAKQSRYALSMSQLVRDDTGLIYDHHFLEKVGTFRASRTRMGFFYSLLTIFPSFDISDDVNAQVAAAGGEAVVGVTVSARDGCQALNAAAIFNILPIWPGCVPVMVTGDIVRRRRDLVLHAAAPSSNAREIAARTPAMAPVRLPP